jgi:hypothetical protein
MTVKLNLTINEKVAAKSKQYAAKKGVSVSRLVEEYLEKLTNGNREKEKGFVQRTAGTLRIKISSVDKAKDEYLKKKYGV